MSCTLPVFLVVVAGAIPRLGFVAGVATFLIYGIGMSTLLQVVTLALAVGRGAVVGWLRRSSQYVNRIAGGILILAGTYIVVLWISTLTGDGTSPLAAVVWVERRSSTVTNVVADRALSLGVASAVVLTAATATAPWRRRGAVRTGTAPGTRSGTHTDANPGAGPGSGGR